MYLISPRRIFSSSRISHLSNHHLCNERRYVKYNIEHNTVTYLKSKTIIPEFSFPNIYAQRFYHTTFPSSSDHLNTTITKNEAEKKDMPIVENINETKETNEEEEQIIERVKEFIKNGEIQQAEEIYQREKVENNKELRGKLLSIIVNYYIEHRIMGEVERCYQELLSLSISPAPLVYAELLQYYLVANIRSKITEHYLVMKSKNYLKYIPKTFHQILYLRLISSCVNSGDIATANAYIDDMHFLNVSLNVILYNAMISVCIKDGLIEKAEEFYNSMILSSLQPNQFIFTSMISVAIKSRKYDRVEKYYQDMCKLGIQPNLYIFTSLINFTISRISSTLTNPSSPSSRKYTNKPTGDGEVNVAHNDVNDNDDHHHVNNNNNNNQFANNKPVRGNYIMKNLQAKNNLNLSLNKSIDDYYNELLALKIQPNIVLFSTIIGAYVSFNDLPKAEFYYSEMARFNIAADKSILSMMIHICHKHWRPMKADYYYQELLKVDKPTSLVTNVMINLCAGDVPRAERYMNDLIASNQRLNHFVVTTFFKVCSKAKNFDAAHKLYLSLTTSSLNVKSVLNSSGYSALMAVCNKTGREHLIGQLYQDMLRFDITPDTIIFSILFGTCLQQPDDLLLQSKIEELLNELERLQLKPDLLILNTLIDIYLKRNMLARAEEMFERLRAVRPDHLTLYNFILLCVQCNDVAKLEHFYSLFGKYNIPVYRTTFELIIRFYCNQKDADKIEFYYTQMRNRNIVPDPQVLKLLIDYWTDAENFYRVKELTNLLPRSHSSDEK